MAGHLGALSYPYVAIEDAAWLKRTLLLFPYVTRMVPSWGPDLPDEINRFTRSFRGAKPLLRRAELQDPMVEDAQSRLLAELARRLDANRGAFLRRFGREASLTAGATRIYPAKLIYALTDFLFRHDLAWHPEEEQTYPVFQVNARLGEAIMATIGQAVALNEGLRMVTEFPELHGKAIRSTPDRIFADFLDERPPKPRRVEVDALADVIIYQRCRVDHLSAEDIAEIAIERRVYAAFREALASEIKALPTRIGSPKVFAEAMNEAANDIFRSWDQDRSNFSPLAKRAFGEAKSDALLAGLGKVIEKLVEPTATGAITFAGAVHAGVQVLPAAGASAAIALVHGGYKAYRATRAARAEGPWKYLTILEQHGVGFTMVA